MTSFAFINDNASKAIELIQQDHDVGSQLVGCACFRCRREQMLQPPHNQDRPADGGRVHWSRSLSAIHCRLVFLRRFILGCCGRVGLVSLRRVLPGRDDRVPQPFHVVEQILAAGLADHLAEQVTEKPDVPAHQRGQLLPVRLPGHAPSASLLAVRPRGLSLSPGHRPPVRGMENSVGQA